MSEKKEFYVIEASDDGVRQSEIIFGTKEDARKKLCELMWFGTYEEAQKNEMIAAILETFDNEENDWSGDWWDCRLEQGYLRVGRIDRFQQFEECEATLQVFADHYFFVAREYFDKWGKK